MKKLKIFFVVCLFGALAFCFWWLKNEEDIKVSVIVPVYNSEKYLRKCLDSLQKQTLTGLEFIVINDGSTDKSYEIMQQYAAQDKRFRIYTQENGGVGKTRNRGMMAAKGEYIGFVDSDDYVSPNYFEKLYSAAKKYKADVAVTVHAMMCIEGKFAAMNVPLLAYADKKVIDDLHFMVGNMGQQWDKIYKREFLVKHNIWSLEEKIWFEDEWFSTLVAVYAHKISIVDGTMYFYRRYREDKGVSRFAETKDVCLKGVGIYEKLILKLKNDIKKTEESRYFQEKIRGKQQWLETICETM